MKKRLMLGISILILGALAACSSTPTKEQDGASVEDRKPQVVDRAPVKPAQPDTRPLTGKGVAGNPLTDPGNILSKRSVFFDYDSNLVKDEFKPLVTAHARYLQQNPSAKMKVEGNADDRGSREMLRDIVEPAGYRPVLAASGEEALDIVREEPIHLALFDMHMPRLTGLETLQLVRQFNAILPCILVTADSTPKARQSVGDAEPVAIVGEAERSAEQVGGE